MPTTWFIVRDGKQHGPITDAEFRKLIELGHLKGTDFVWHDGAPDWMPGTQFLAAPRGTTPSAGAAATEPARPQSPSQGPRQGAAQVARPSTPRRGARSLSAPDASQRPAKHRLGLRIAIGVLLAAVLAGAGKLAFDQLGFDEIAFNKVGESLARPQSQRAAIERRLLTDPKLKWLQILQEKQPSTYAEVMDALMARVQNKEPIEASIDHIRTTYVVPIFSANAPHLADEAMTRYIVLIAEQMALLSEKNPRLCVLLLRGQPVGDVRPYLNETLIAQEMQLIEEALSVDKTKPAIRYTPAEQSQIMAMVVAKVAQQHGDLVRLIDPATPVEGRERDTCIVGASFFRVIGLLPAPSAAALMRSLLLSARK